MRLPATHPETGRSFTLLAARMAMAETGDFAAWLLWMPMQPKLSPPPYATKWQKMLQAVPFNFGILKAATDGGGGMTTAWLEAHVPSFAELSTTERQAIADFTMLWTLFESRVLATQGSAQKIMEVVEGWEQTGTLDAASYDRELGYFQDRYVANGEMTRHFDGLKLRANDQPALVQAVLDGSDASSQGRLIAMLIVVLRYRNNLFHGIKWQYKLKGQLDNFSHANAVLMRVLEQHGDLHGE